MTETLLTGGSGRLGKEIRKLKEVFAPTRQQMDVMRSETYIRQDFGTIIHAAAYTDVARAEVDRKTCFDLNVWATSELLRAYPQSNFIFISSEFANHPVNYYGETKRMAEALVLQRGGVALRTLFKPRPYPWEYAYIDQHTQGDYVDVIAGLIVKFLSGFHESDIYYIGTGTKTMFELAKQTRPDVKPNSIKDSKNVRIPEWF